MSSRRGLGFQPLRGNAGAATRRCRGAGKVKGQRGGVVEQRGEECLSSRGVPVEGYLRGLECREQNRSHRGHGSRMSQGRDTFDSSGGDGFEDTHTHTHNLS